VSQIARTIARALRLNESLTEAIAMGHDLGHTPFGHAGERALAKLVPGGFHHGQQSVRVVEVLEHDGMGLNLSFEVRDGILKHSKGKGPIVSDNPELSAVTLEGQIARIADIAAYVNHDLDDAIRGHILSEHDLPAEVVAVLGSTTANASAAWSPTRCWPRASTKSARFASARSAARPGHLARRAFRTRVRTRRHPPGVRARRAGHQRAMGLLPSARR